MRYSNSTNQKQVCVIEGLNIGVNDINKTNQKVAYEWNELDLLLLNHSDKIVFKLVDELFFNPETIDVFEFDGSSYAIKYQRN